MACHWVYSSGERVSNTWATYPQDGDNPGKLGLIPDAVSGLHDLGIKGGHSWKLLLVDGPAFH